MYNTTTWAIQLYWQYKNPSLTLNKQRCFPSHESAIACGLNLSSINLCLLKSAWQATACADLSVLYRSRLARSPSTVSFRWSTQAYHINHPQDSQVLLGLPSWDSGSILWQQCRPNPRLSRNVTRSSQFNGQFHTI